MTKRQLIASLAERLEIAPQTSENLLDTLRDLSIAELKRVGVFDVPGITTITLRKRAARVGRNPMTGQPIDIPAKDVLKARVPTRVKEMAAAVSGGLESDDLFPPKEDKKT